MPKSFRFWMTLGAVALAHVFLVITLIKWSRADSDAHAPGIVWMGGGGGDGIASEKKNPSTLEKSETRMEPKIAKSRDEEDDRPVLTSAPSEIQLPPPRPLTTATPRPTPNVKGTPKPKPKPSPKPTPKPTPRPSPKKLTLAKASPKPSPKEMPASEDKEEKKSDSAQADNKKIVLAKNETTKPVADKSPAAQTGSGKGTNAGTGGGHAGGSVNESQFGWYGSMLHDRFYSEWAQPTSVANAGGKNSVLVKLRIEKDGRVSSFEIVRSSGNAELDDSVKELANRVSHVEPLPDGLGKGDHYDVKINFELNSE
jgi:TonB family protein